MKNDFEKARNLIDKSNSILLTCHDGPDPDALGSLLSLSEYLTAKKKKHFCYVYGGASKRLSFLPDFSKLHSKIPNSKKFDLIIGLDYGSFYRIHVDEYLEKQIKKPKILTIDHHRFGDKKGDAMLFYPDASSTCEIVCNFFYKIHFPVNKKMATLLLAGIVSDTVSLKINATPKVFRIVANLLEKGVDFTSSTAKLYRLKSLNSLKLKGRVFQKTKFYPKAGLVTAKLYLKEYEKILGDPEEISLLVEELAALPEAKAALFLKEEKKGEWYGEMRSRQNFNVGLTAKNLGGGGHRGASGFHSKGNPDKIIKKVIQTIEKIHES